MQDSSATIRTEKEVQNISVLKNNDSFMRNPSTIKMKEKEVQNIPVVHNNKSSIQDTSAENIQNNVDIFRKLNNVIANNNSSSIQDTSITSATNNEGIVALLLKIADTIGIANNVEIVSKQKTDKTQMNVRKEKIQILFMLNQMRYFIIIKIFLTLYYCNFTNG